MIGGRRVTDSLFPGVEYSTVRTGERGDDGNGDGGLGRSIFVDGGFVLCCARPCATVGAVVHG